MDFGSRVQFPEELDESQWIYGIVHDHVIVRRDGHVCVQDLCGKGGGFQHVHVSDTVSGGAEIVAAINGREEKVYRRECFQIFEKRVCEIGVSHMEKAYITHSHIVAECGIISILVCLLDRMGCGYRIYGEAWKFCFFM